MMMSKQLASPGLIEALDRMHAHALPNVAINQRPCAWAATKGVCARHADPTQRCPKCEHGAAPLAAVLSAAKTACNADTLGKLPASSPVSLAA